MQIKRREFIKNMDSGRVALLALNKSKPKAHLILSWMTGVMKDNNSVVVSNDAIAEILGLCRSTVDKSLRVLRENNFIKSARTGRSNIYYINPKIAKVVDDRGNAMYYKFKSDVVLSDSELRQFSSDIKFNEDNTDNNFRSKL
jgi:hypothetical protein